MILPELFCGFERSETDPLVQVPVSCVPQAWSAGAPFLLLQAAMGLNYDPNTDQLYASNDELPPLFKNIHITKKRSGQTMFSQ
jgi:glycogen debranching enzyme